jgi:hypothetical protein
MRQPLIAGAPQLVLCERLTCLPCGCRFAQSATSKPTSKQFAFSLAISTKMNWPSIALGEHNRRTGALTKYLDKNGVEIDVDGLPEELLAELKIIPDDLEDKVFELLPVDGSGISLDQVLVDLYKKHGLLKKRRFMQSKLYRMKNVVCGEGQNGIYARHPALVEAE